MNLEGLQVIAGLFSFMTLPGRLPCVRFLNPLKTCYPQASWILYHFGYNLGMINKEKPIHWVGKSLQEFQAMLQAFPDHVRDTCTYSLYLAQLGSRHEHVKCLQELRIGTLQLLEQWHQGAYCAVYTLSHTGGVYVLYCFHRAADHVISPDMSLLQSRLQLVKAQVEG